MDVILNTDASLLALGTHCEGCVVVHFGVVSEFHVFQDIVLPVAPSLAPYSEVAWELHSLDV